MTTREFEKSLKSHSIRNITTQKPRKSLQQLSTAFLLRIFAGKYLFQFVIDIPIQILIIFTLRVWAACGHAYIFINPRSRMTIQDAKTVSDEIEKGAKKI